MRPPLAIVLTILVVAPAARAADVPPLVKARAAYNGAKFDEAIAAATDALKQKGAPDPARLVLARALLERFRLGADAADLASAREALRAIDRAKLAPHDQVELTIGVGQALYLDDAFGAAAEVFEPVLTGTAALASPDRSRLLDWWAGSLDHEARSRAADRRAALYGRIAGLMEQELRQDPASPPASYWLAAALRGAGDLDRAWAAASAAWARATVTPESTTSLRADIDRLVTEVLVAERSRLRPLREQADAANALRAEWDAFKSRWP